MEPPPPPPPGVHNPQIDGRSLVQEDIVAAGCGALSG